MGPLEKRYGQEGGGAKLSWRASEWSGDPLAKALADEEGMQRLTTTTTTTTTTTAAHTTTTATTTTTAAATTTTSTTTSTTTTTTTTINHTIIIITTITIFVTITTQRLVGLLAEKIPEGPVMISIVTVIITHM